MFVLIKNGNVFAPKALGKKDVLLFADKIVQIADHIDPPAGCETQVIDAAGKSVTPGIVDTHVHLLGAGGGGGPETRSSVIHFSTLTRAGITTVIGTLGLDTMGFTPRELYIRARALEREGLSTYMLTGSYAIPSVTITGSVPTDIVCIDKVVGLKIAMREVVCCGPDRQQLAPILAEVVRAGRWSAKAGVIVAHQGEVPGSLSWVCDMMEEMAIPKQHFVATHINRNPVVFDDAIACAKRGMLLDLTGNVPQDNMIPASKALRRLIDEGIPLENITFTSDSGAYHNDKGRDVILPVDLCAKEFRLMVKDEGISIPEALAPLTINPARIYRLDDKKGSLESGKDADVLLWDDDLKVDTVIAKGKVVVEAGKAVVRGRLEESYAKLLV
jgi:beta-aspartyl-dipeptidase (metallo-type)